MLQDNDLVKVTNRDNGKVGYIIPDMNNLYRTFLSGESKDIRMEELRKLCFNTRSGRDLVKNYFIIHNPEAVKELLNEVEPEYYYTDENVKELLLHGSLDQLEDCLKFGTEGVKNLVKKYAVELEVDENSKRELILKKLNFDVNNAIRIKKESEEDEGQEIVENKTRKAAPIVNAPTAATTTATLSDDKYTVVK